MKILNVDDRDENRYLLESLFRGIGQEVVSVNDGVEALERLEREKFDLIISDILMPHMDGFQLCREVKQRERLKQIPFIFYTATYTDRKDEELALSLGASRFIVKPSEPERFAATIRDVLREQEQGTAAALGPSFANEEAFLKAHNERLVHKLERKVLQLESFAGQLQTALEEKEGLLQKTKDAVRARDEFLAVASHELRTPITSVLLAVQRASSGLRPDSPANGTRLLAVAARQCKRLANLVQEMLDLADLRGGRFRLSLAPVDLSAVVRDVSGRFADELTAAGSALSVKLRAPVIGRWDRFRLEQMVENLLSNAVRFGGGKPIEMVVESHGETARLTVADHGLGIAADRLPLIFEPFTRAVSLREYGGLGLGLFIVRRIAEALGGSVNVTSEPGKGSTFSVELPLSGPTAAGELS